MNCERVGNAIICSSSRRYNPKTKAAAAALFSPAIEIGREYIVSKYWTGTFKGRLIAVSEMGSILRFLVIDTMRPGPLIEERCPFPECMAAEDHDGDHVFSEFRNGIEIEIKLGHVQLRAAIIEQEKVNMPG